MATDAGLLVLAAALLLALLVALALRERPARDALGERRRAQGKAGVIEYFAHGCGPTMVLLASFARSGSDFNELAAALGSAGYRTLAVQSRGVGGSTLGRYGATLHDFARDVVAVLQAEQVSEPVAIVGHAFGNRVARTVATDFPDRVDRLVLLSGGGEVPPPTDVSRAIQTGLFGFWSARARRAAIARAFFARGNKVPPSWEYGWYPWAGLVQAHATAVTPFAPLGRWRSRPRVTGAGAGRSRRASGHWAPPGRASSSAGDMARTRRRGARHAARAAGPDCQPGTGIHAFLDRSRGAR